MDRIIELEQKIAALQEGKNPASDSIWRVLDEQVKGIDETTVAVINSSDEVKSAESDMMSVFLKFYLFPKYRDEFSSVPTFRPLCDKYISAVVTAKQEGIKHSLELAEENKRLKAELARLKK